MKIYVHDEEGEGERNGNSDYTRKWDSLSTALEEAILPFQETATRPRDCLYHLIPSGIEKYLYPRLLHNPFSSPVMVAFFPYFLQFPTYQLCMPEVPYTMFLKHQTFLSPNCGLTMFLQHSLLYGKQSKSFFKTRLNQHSQGKPSHLSPGPSADWIFFWIVKTVFAHFWYILFSEAPQWSR